MDIYETILASLASGEKTCPEIAAERGLTTGKVSGALVTLISRGQVVVVGKTRSKCRDVAIYASSPVIKSANEGAQLDKADEQLVIATQLHHKWGGYI